MLHQSKEVLCICVSFQEPRDSIKEEPETNIYLHVLIILEEALTHFRPKFHLYRNQLVGFY